MNNNYHNHALYALAGFATPSTPRFKVYRSLHLGTRGPAGSEYIVVDAERQDRHGNEHQTSFDNQSGVKCYIAKHWQGLECAPWFGPAARDGHIRNHKVAMARRKDWNQ